MRRGSLILLFLLSLVLLLHRGRGAYERFRDQVPLQLPGAEFIRLPKTTVEIYQRLVLNLQSNCDTFLAFPSLNSLYFWTRIPPPTPFNATWWPRMLEQGQQLTTIASLEAHERACFVFDTRHKMNKGDLDRSPLLTYLQQNFHGAASIGPFELRTRDGSTPRSFGEISP